TETKVRQQARQETRTDVHEAVEAVAADHAGTSDPQTRSGEAWYERGRELYDDERYGEASDAYEKAARAGYRSATAWYNAACSHALAGRSQAALEALQRAVDRGFDRADLIRRDDDLNSIRSTARFRALLDQARHTDAAEAKRKSVVADYE